MCIELTLTALLAFRPVIIGTSGCVFISAGHGCHLRPLERASLCASVGCECVICIGVALSEPFAADDELPAASAASPAVSIGKMFLCDDLVRLSGRCCTGVGQGDMEKKSVILRMGD